MDIRTARKKKAMTQTDAIQKAIEALERIQDSTASIGFDRGIPHVSEMARSAIATLKEAGDEWELIGDKHRNTMEWMTVDEHGARRIAAWSPSALCWRTIPGLYEFNPTHAMSLPDPPALKVEG